MAVLRRDIHCRHYYYYHNELFSSASQLLRTTSPDQVEHLWVESFVHPSIFSSLCNGWVDHFTRLWTSEGNAIVQPVRLALPKLHGMGRQQVSTPDNKESQLRIYLPLVCFIKLGYKSSIHYS